MCGCLCVFRGDASSVHGGGGGKFFGWKVFVWVLPAIQTRTYHGRAWCRQRFVHSYNGGVGSGAGVGAGGDDDVGVDVGDVFD